MMSSKKKKRKKKWEKIAFIWPKHDLSYTVLGFSKSAVADSTR